MDSAVEVNPEKIRTTITQTHKQAFISYSAVAGMSALITFMGHFFQTKPEAALQAQSIAVQTAQISDIKTEIKSSESRVIEAIHQEVKPVAAQVEHHETRIVNLEFINMQKSPKQTK